MRIYIPLRRVVLSEQNLYEICRYIRNGALFSYPTDTVYGLGCTASAKESLKRIYSLKGLAGDSPLSLLYPSRELLEADFQTTPEILGICKALLPNPLTVIVPAPVDFPYHEFVSEDGFVGIRYIRYTPMQEILSRLNEPIVSTSANPHGMPPAGNSKEVLQYFPDSIDLLLEYDEELQRKPSTIVKLLKNKLQIVREGEFPIQALYSFFQSIKIECSDQELRK